MLRKYPWNYSIIEPLFCGSEKIPQNSRQISLWKIKKIHRRASAGALGENFCRRAIFAPNFEVSEPERMQFHTPSRSIPPLDSLLHMMGSLQSKDLYATGPVQFSWPCGAAESWFSKRLFGSILLISPRKTAKHVERLSSPCGNCHPQKQKTSNLAPKISKTGNTALKLPNCPLLRDILGDLRATFLADLARKLFLDVIFLFGVCGLQGLCSSSMQNTTEEPGNLLNPIFWI